jgi:hypothetical protein
VRRFVEFLFQSYVRFASLFEVLCEFLFQSYVCFASLFEVLTSVEICSEFLLDFFKPNTADLERIKAVKKHRHGRRVKQLEKIEQKMKEERQKRIRERQKEFFADIEAHRFGNNLHCIHHFIVAI